MLSQYERGEVLLEASSVRMAVEGHLNERISLERGVVALMTTNPGLDEPGYAAFASALVGNDSCVKNLAVLEGTTVKFVYPFEPNKAAVGKDLSAIPEQAESVRRAKETREPIVSGPIPLVQGGAGIVSRMGIFPAGPAGPEYWGQASVVFDVDLMLGMAGLSAHPGLRIVIRADGDAGLGPTTIFGGTGPEGADPVSLTIDLPGASWSLLATPKDGWKSYRWITLAAAAVGLTIGMLAGLSLYGLLATRSALKELAYHDQLTELPNRSLFWDRLRVEASRADRDGTKVCVFMIDLDDFKSVNDDHGHDAGDRLLAESAARMSGAIRKSDTVARLGGDEFAVIAPVDSPAGVEEVRERLRACFAEPFGIGGVKRTARASIGSSIYPDDGTDIEAVLAIADARMYKEKRPSEPTLIAARRRA